MRSLRDGVALSILAASTMFVATEAAAQTDDDAIVVTATRREEALQDVPLAVQAITGDNLREQGVTSVYSLTQQTPSLVVTSGGGETQAFYSMRGIGTYDYNPAAPPTVAYYTDELFINQTFGQGGQMYDVARVEVLQGPQGTLWGKNTIAGVVNIVNNRPTDQNEGYFSAEVGDYGRRKFEGAVSGPLVEGVLNGRLSILTNSYDGYQYDTGLHERRGGSDWSAARLQLDWTISDNTDLLFKYETADMSQDLTYRAIGVFPGGTNGLGIPIDNNASLHTIQNSRMPESWSTNENLTAILNHTFGNGIQLTNIAGYFTTTTRLPLDLDSVAAFLSHGDPIITSDQVSNEIRFTSPSDQRLTWIVGGFYLKENLFVDYPAFTSAPNLVFTGPGTADDIFPDGMYGGLRFSYAQESESKSLFGSATYHFDDTLDLTVGLRYSKETIRTEAWQGISYVNPGPDPLNPDLTGNLDYFNLDTLVYQIGQRGTGNLDEGLWTWDATLTKHWSDDLMTYVRVARGVRAPTFDNFTVPDNPGGVPTPGDFSDDGPVPALDAEKMTAYEIGFKSDWGHWATFNGAAFYYDFENKQVVSISDTDAALQTFNQAPLEVRGVEASLAIRPTSYFSGGASVTWLDTEWGHYRPTIASEIQQGNEDLCGLNSDGDPQSCVDVTGGRLARAPEWIANLYAQFEASSPVGLWTLRTDWQYRSEAFARDEWSQLDEITPPPGGVDEALFKSAAVIPAYWLGDVSLSLAPNDRFRVRAFVRNVTDEEYFNSTNYDNTGSIHGDVGAPRTYGIGLDYNF